jgi:hypothetical protein
MQEFATVNLKMSYIGDEIYKIIAIRRKIAVGIPQYDRLSKNRHASCYLKIVKKGITKRIIRIVSIV